MVEHYTACLKLILHILVVAQVQTVVKEQDTPVVDVEKQEEREPKLVLHHIVMALVLRVVQATLVELQRVVENKRQLEAGEHSAERSRDLCRMDRRPQGEERATEEAA